MVMAALIVFLCLCVAGVFGLQYDLPDNTCPQYLKFDEIYGLAVGVLEIPNDGTGDYTLSVNGSLPFQTNERLKISIPDYQDIIKQPMSTIRYHLYFASQLGYPRITSVQFNGRLLCFASPYPLGPNGRTRVWAQSKLIATIQEGVIGQNGGNPLPPTVQRPTPSPPIVSPVTQPQPPPSQSTNFTFSRPRPNPPIIKPGPRPTPTPQPSIEPFTSANNDKMCGVVLNSIPLILSGTPVVEYEFPWMTALYRYSNQEKNYRFLCTASLISDRHVITAGHCVNYEGIILYDMEDLIFVFGRTKLDNWARYGVIGEVGKVTVHPNYEQGRSGHDLAIFTLSKPLQFSSVVYPLCIWDSIVGGSAQEGVVAGWGQTEANKRVHDIVPYKLTMPVVSQEECENSHPVYVGLTSNYVFCAGAKDGSGPCGGDSGAGFVVKIGGRHYLKGIVAHVETKNATSCNLSTYVLFADLVNEKDWIKSVINETK